MLVLSFRDLSAAKSGGVTAGAMVDLAGMGMDFDWNRPASLRQRLSQGQARYVPWGEVKRRLAGKSVCFVVHGFNVDRDHGYAGEGALAQEMLGLGRLFPAAGRATLVDLVIPVLWPGDWYLPGVNYPFEMGDVRATGRRFDEFLRSDAQRASRISFVSHSLGARVVLEAVSHAAGKISGRFETAVLTAAAADDDILDDPRYAVGVAALREIIVVSSFKDSVLADAFPVGDRIEAALWNNEKASDRALGRFGPARLKPGSAARGKVRWFDIDPGENCGHDGYFPWPWNPEPPLPNGWTAQRKKLGQFLRETFSPGPPATAWPKDMKFPD
jgi:hypothetical protein